MASAMNGIALHGGLIPYGGTFLTFADYSRPAIRLAALMGIRVIHVMTHDSIGLGEDGPTHQPVEHCVVRAIPNLLVFRPGDAVRPPRRGIARWEQTSPSYYACHGRQCRRSAARRGRQSGSAGRLCDGRAGRWRDAPDCHGFGSIDCAEAAAKLTRGRQRARGGRFGTLLRPVSPAIARIPRWCSGSVPELALKRRSKVTGRAGSATAANSSA